MSDDITIILVDEYDWRYSSTSEPPAAKSEACALLYRAGCDPIDAAHYGLIIAHARGSAVLAQLREFRNGRGAAVALYPNLYDRAYFLREGHSDLRGF